MDIQVEERVAKARALFLEGYNCSQAVFVAYCDLFGLEPRFAAGIAAPMGGGMGRMREVCGAVSGMSLIAGRIERLDDPTDRECKKRLYALIQQLAERFRAENGAIVCRELLGLSCRSEDPTPSERTASYYRKRPCADLVASAARIVGEYLAERAGQI